MFIVGLGRNFKGGAAAQLTPEQVVNSYQLKHKTAHGLVVRGAYPEEQVASSNPFRDCFLHYFFPIFSTPGSFPRACLVPSLSSGWFTPVSLFLSVIFKSM